MMGSIVGARVRDLPSKQANFIGEEIRTFEEVESVLEGQIKQLADPSNYELRSWFGYDPRQLDSLKIRGLGKNSISLNAPCGLSNGAGMQVSLEVVVFDLHDVVIKSCHQEFSSLNLPVILHQAPIQCAILDSLQGEDPDLVETFVVFGGYGNGQINSGLQKQLAEAFPEQMQNLQQQALAGVTDPSARDPTSEIGWQLNSANQGNVWLAVPPILTHEGRPVHLVSCAAYPRCQQPSEQEHVMNMFYKALCVVAGSTVAFATLGQVGTTGHRTFRVVTHAMGSFLGHMNPELFAWGLAKGLQSFVSEHGQTVVPRQA